MSSYTETADEAKKEPLFRVVKRDNASMKRKVGVYIGALFTSLVISSVFVMIFTKLNPFEVLSSLFSGSFTSDSQFWAVLKDTAMLLLIGVALAPAFKMRFWNIGAQGQLLMGALFAAFCIIKIGTSVPTAVLFLLMILGSIAVGGLWGAIPAFFKAKFGTNETLFTLMMNYVAIQIVDCCVTIWRGSKSGLGTIGQIGGGKYIGALPTFLNKYFLVILLVAIVTVLMAVYLKKTKQGYELSVVGESLNTARYAGINVAKVIIRTMFISGAIAGFGGFLYVSGISHTISISTGGNNGFTAIIVSWIAQFNPVYMILISFLLVFLQYGAKQISSDYTGLLNDYAGEVITAIFIFCIIAFAFFINYRLVMRDGKGKIFFARISLGLKKVFAPIGKFFKKIFTPVGKFFHKAAAEIGGICSKVVEKCKKKRKREQKKNDDENGETGGKKE